jgi:DNA-binding MarR family transcriptional regulator/N-acetylglutamate synthase-like GNAT family acetyltransferase
MAALARTVRTQEAVAQIRRFNRFYTRRIGLLTRGFLESEFSLTEVRVLYELSHHPGITAREIGAETGIDAGYISRMLQDFERRGLLLRSASPADARQSLLRLTPKGRAAFAELDRRQDKQIASLLASLPTDGRPRLLAAMHGIERLLAPAQPAREPYILRPHQPGDMGWVVHRHGALYASEWGYDERFEALVAHIVAHFIQHFDPKRERCWIAEREGEIAGSVFLVRKSKTVAKLRLLLVEPSARGLGIGRRLVEECIHFARRAKYKKIVLWTQSELRAARRIYQRSGFKLAGKKRHSDFGKLCVAETWELKL